jgi:hypothetical protein
VVVTRTVRSPSPIAIALAFLAGIAAGGGGVYLARYLRRAEGGKQREWTGDEPDPESDVPPASDVEPDAVSEADATDADEPDEPDEPDDRGSDAP